MSQTPEILDYFAFAHLPAGRLQETSKLFHDLAHQMHAELPECEEKAALFRKLLEAKDCAVRSCLIKSVAK